MNEWMDEPRKVERPKMLETIGRQGSKMLFPKIKFIQIVSIDEHNCDGMKMISYRRVR